MPAKPTDTTIASNADAPINPVAALLANAMLGAVLNGPRRGPAPVEARNVPAKPAPAARALVLA